MIELYPSWQYKQIFTLYLFIFGPCSLLDVADKEKNRPPKRSLTNGNEMRIFPHTEESTAKIRKLGSGIFYLNGTTQSSPNHVCENFYHEVANVTNGWLSQDERQDSSIMVNTNSGVKKLGTGRHFLRRVLQENQHGNENLHLGKFHVPNTTKDNYSTNTTSWSLPPFSNDIMSCRIPLREISNGPQHSNDIDCQHLRKTTNNQEGPNSTLVSKDSMKIVKLGVGKLFLRGQGSNATTARSNGSITHDNNEEELDVHTSDANVHEALVSNQSTIHNEGVVIGNTNGNTARSSGSIALKDNHTMVFTMPAQNHYNRDYRSGTVVTPGQCAMNHNNENNNNEEQLDVHTSDANVHAPLVSNQSTIHNEGAEIGNASNEHIAGDDGENNALPDDTILSYEGYFDIGDPIWKCEFCNALMWYSERVEKRRKSENPKFSLCCMQGKIRIPHLTPPPQPLSDLFHKKDARSKYFLQNIRSFNMMFSFTSLGGRIEVSQNDGNGPPMFIMNGENYHRIGSLLPLPGEKPKFAQLYIYDTDNEISNRMEVVGMKDDSSPVQRSIVSDLKQLLDQYNPYAKAYRMVRDRVQNNEVAPLKLRLIGQRGHHARTYNLPTASEVAALIVGDFDASSGERDIIVETQSNSLKRVSVLSSAYLPLQYPLLFSRGEQGYTDDIPLYETKSARSNKRRNVSMREFYAYRFQNRDSERACLLFSKRLFQQLLVDVYSTIESSRLYYYRTHQREVRADMYKGIEEAILRGDTNPAAVGKRIVLPSSFRGGARYMFQNYQDAMAICRWMGYPDLFITFTCNQNWPELYRYLSTQGLKSEDRPDLICRVFKIKLDEMIKEIKEGKVFGLVRAVIYTIEFQKRGLPHAHILIFLHPQYRYPHPDDIDKIISAELPDEESDPELLKIVSSLMVHGPCGVENKKAPCMQNGKCTRHFPKKYAERTSIDEDGYPLYMRRENGRVIQKGDHVIDNRFVVPYNRHLLMRYNAHINVEWCNQSRSIKYLFKYVNKGHDRVTTGFYDAAPHQADSGPVDEIKLYYDCRYLSSCEAAWRLFAFDINYREPSVERLTFHLPNEQHVIFDEGDSLQEVLDAQAQKKTKFLAWMDANAKYPDARGLTYAQFPSKFVWKQPGHEWVHRKRGNTVGRLHFVPPATGELYYLRTLLNHVTGPKSFVEIRTIDNIVYPTFKDACNALGLLGDDKEYIDAIIESSFWGTGEYMRFFFAILMVSNQMCTPHVVWEKTWKYLSDDIQHRQRLLL
ncbi:unnamed protein product [Cuscuta epithymum]|uniref:Helitron helicase-like domain-containing protein n=1 Tax=Cuscuta epithymum TaxID=186058 RepID=A0AAV0G3B1_9ASTE|nr:unnamed protein product [Cuscuta epithymum]